MGLIFGLVVLLLLVTLVGHGIWVVLRGLFHMLVPGPGSVDPSLLVTLCRQCGHPWEHQLATGPCSLCGWSPRPGLRSNQPRPDLALAQLRRRVERFGQLGMLSASTRDRIVEVIRAEEKTLATAVVPDGSAIPPVGRPLVETSPQPGDDPRHEAPPEPFAPAARVRAMREWPRREGVEAAAAQPTSTGDRPHRFFELLSAFLEEKSIRWGELVGGLLIVGCSLALVISFWSSIAERPLIKYVLLNGVTALLFGLGMHADRRWKLPTTALGLLIIATLLTPLNFLAVASLVRGTTAQAGWSLLGEAVAVVIFAGLVLRAGRSLVAGAPWALLVAVVVPSASMLLFSRSVGPDRVLATALALGSLPWLAAGVAVGGWMSRFRQQTEFGEGLAVELLRLLGLGTFAASVALGFVVVHAWPIGGIPHLMSPLAPLIGGAILAPGLLIWRRVNAPDLIGYRTTGTTVAAAGTLILLAGIALAWPSPARMLPVAVLNFGVFTAIAVLFRVPAGHVLAGLCLTLVYLLGWSIAVSRLGWRGTSPSQTAEVLLSGGSGAALVPIALVCATVAGVLARARRWLDAQAYALVAALAGLLSLGLVTWHGFGVAGDPVGAAWVYAAFALTAPAFAIWLQRDPLVPGTTGLAEARGLGWLSSGLLLAAFVQGVVFGGWPFQPPLPWIVALLGYATVTMGLNLLLSFASGTRFPDPHGTDADFAPVHVPGLPREGLLAEVWNRSSLAATIAGALSLFIAVPIGPASILALDGLWLAGLWMIRAGRSGSAPWFGATQAAVTWAAVFLVAAVLGRRDWYPRSSLPWLDPRMIQAQGLALGLLSLGWIGVRLAIRRRAKTSPVLGRLVDPPWPAFDRLPRAVVVGLMVMLAVYAAVPGVAQELTPHDVAARLLGTDAPGRVVPPLAAFEIPGIPHAPALGAGSWALGGLTIALLLAGQWERFRRLDLLAALVIGALAAPLVAGRWEPSVAAASALRWSSAVVLLAMSALIWSRDHLARCAWWLGWRPDPARAGVFHGQAVGTALTLAFLPLLAMGLYVAGAAVVGRSLAEGLGEAWVVVSLLFVILGGASLAIRGGPVWGRPLLGVLATLPLMAVTIFVVVTSLRGNPMVGPEPGSFFRGIGQAGSFVPPIVVIAATLVGCAIRERSSAFAFAAGLAWNVTATVGFLTLAARAGLRLDAALVVRLAQINATVTAAAALTWIATLVASRRRNPRAEPARDDELLMTAVALGVALNLLLLIGGTTALFFEPLPAPSLPVIAGPLGYLALGMAAAAVVARSRFLGRPVAPDWYGFGLLSLADFLAIGLTLSHPDHWFAYHGVIVGLGSAGLLLPAFTWWRRGMTLEGVPHPIRPVVERWSAIALGIVVAFAIRGYWSDPQSPWWTVGGLLGMGGLAAVLAVWSSRPGYLGLACLLTNLAATCWWVARPAWFVSPAGWPALADLVNLNVVALALPVPLWLAIERRWSRSAWFWSVPFHQVVAWSGLGLLTLVVTLILGDDATGGTGDCSVILGWAAVATVALAMGWGPRDQQARAPIAGLYLLGLVAAGWVVGQFHLPPRWLAWTGTMLLAAYSVGTSFLWSRRVALRALADRLGFPRPDPGDSVANVSWLVPGNLLLAAVVLLLAGLTILTDPELALRSASAHAALAQCLAIGLLARGARRTRLQVVVLGVGVAGAVAWGWAWIAPGSPTGFLDRSAVVLAATGGGAALFGIGLFKLPRSEDDWTRAARRVVPPLLGLGGLVSPVILGSELAVRAQGHFVAMANPAIMVVAVTLAGAALAALVAAVVPGRDPLGLSERERTAYVYGCEGLVAVLGAHVKLTLPWVFSGRFMHYWPLLLMGVAFVGVSLSEIFRRQGRLVLAEPLERTGAFLPLVPLLAAFWNTPRPGEDVVYLALVGCLYATLALIRSSVGFSALAALAGNGAFWSWLRYHDQLSLIAHPQLWVIPPALCVLVGAYLNRDLLTRSQLAGIRYAAATTIYLASTADLVLTGVARAPWLSAVLAALAVVGIFAGILLRVRGFLFLGFGFLGLAVFSMIWYAAVDLHQTWLWAASGIVAGVGILIVFGLFEKKRQDVLRVVGNLREWNP